MFCSRIRRAGLLVESLCRLSPATSPSNSRKTAGKNADNSFHVQCGHSCAIHGRCNTVLAHSMDAREVWSNSRQLCESHSCCAASILPVGQAKLGCYCSTRIKLQVRDGWQLSDSYRWLRKTPKKRYHKCRVDELTGKPANSGSGACWAATVQSVYSGETATLARVLQATAQYSICGWRVYFTGPPSPTTSWSYAHQHLKAAEAKPRGAARQNERGSGVYE